MVTGASTAKLAIILIDARNGVVEQTIRHSYLVSLLGIEHVVVCLNKMDMVGYSETVFHAITEKYKALAAELNLKEVTFIPVSALKGDNVVNESEHMQWYQGRSLLHFLESVDVEDALPYNLARMPVQWVIRPQTDELHDYRGYAGRILSGSFNVNDRVTVLPSGHSSVIDRIEIFDQRPVEAFAGQSVTIHLKDNIDVSRGDVLVNSDHLPQRSQVIEADLCWMDARPLDDSITYLLQHNSKITKCKIREIVYKVDINTLEKQDAHDFKLNDIGRVVLKTADELPFDLYTENKANGAAILVDSRTNLTVAALMFRNVSY
ncbi:sulfate adenylyltransferase subunit 1, partial [Pedobacter sp.]|uniref:sulfate adenylyltransferase subunit 1 n=1 Tax=Pedobacter sp. TaxID=1411316 RepID=UPI002C34C0ED